MQILKTIIKNQKITYSQVGDDYNIKDPIKKLAQNAASDV